MVDVVGRASIVGVPRGHRVLVIVLSGCLATAAQGCARDRITGRVLDNFDQPVIGATVSIPHTAFIGVTNSEGFFRLDYAPGTFHVAIEAPGFERVELPEVSIAQKVAYPLPTLWIWRTPRTPVETPALATRDGFVQIPLVSTERRAAGRSRFGECFQTIVPGDVHTYTGNHVQLVVPHLPTSTFSLSGNPNYLLVRAREEVLVSMVSNGPFTCAGTGETINLSYRSLGGRRYIDFPSVATGLYCFMQFDGMARPSRRDAFCFRFVQNTSITTLPVALPRANAAPAPPDDPPTPVQSDVPIPSQALPSTVPTPSVALVPTATTASSFLDRGREHHPPRDAFDDDPRTAWNEGVPGSGAGEWIEAAFDGPRRIDAIRLATGWNVTSRHGHDLFVLNAHLRRIRFVFDGGVTREADVEEGQREITVDVRGVTSSRVRIIAAEVWDGTQYQDLCISDVVVLGG